MFKTTLAISLLAIANATFCSYPMWTNPGTGSEGRCDWEDCPMLPEEKCDDIYGTFEEEQCTVYCRNNPSQTEVWECAGDETWELVSEPADYFATPAEAISGSTLLQLSAALVGLMASNPTSWTMSDLYKLYIKTITQISI